MLNDFLIVINPLTVGFNFLFDTYLIWLPIFLIYVSWNLWVRYLRANFIAEKEMVLLEIKLPRDLMKSPKAMELFLNNLHQTGGENNPFDKYWKGGIRAWFSLELVSIEGQVKFFIWTRDEMKEIVETQIYAQYPDVEVSETPDYSLNVHYDPEKITLWGTEFELTKEDPYPIKTYVDYGLDKDPKEEFKVDPISNVIEYLGSLGQGEQAWIQIIVRAHKKKKLKDQLLWKKTEDWKEKGEELINELLERDKSDKGDDMGKFFKIRTEGEKDVITAIERSISKHGFDCGMRVIYLAEEDKFRKVNIGGLISSVKQYSSQNLNGFKPNKKSMTKFDYPWQDYKKKRLSKRKVKILDAYRRRGYFYPPHRRKSFVLSSEELATIFHFPGDVVQTPTLSRIESKKAEAPINLPT